MARLEVCEAARLRGLHVLVDGGLGDLGLAAARPRQQQPRVAAVAPPRPRRQHAVRPPPRLVTAGALQHLRNDVTI